MGKSSSKADAQTREGTRTLQEIAEAVERERDASRSAEAGFGKGVESFGPTARDEHESEQLDVIPNTQRRRNARKPGRA